MSTKKKSKSTSSSATAAPAIKKAESGASVRIEYDTETYANHYSHMAANLVKGFPNLRCFGQRATPTLKGMLLAFLIFIVQGLLALTVFHGETFLLNNFDYKLDFYVSQFIKDYQMIILIPIVFITPLMQYAGRSGKFEVYLNGMIRPSSACAAHAHGMSCLFVDVLIHSKHQTNQLPSVADLLVKEGLKSKDE
ncbi:hypothetical protein DYB34_001207 [Aphanomyces astaci]|uniref:Uncharacterized protein n=1 Tax=Aphanomyces astaci TaxID=112090 RepID=A0A3R6VJG9_APHAT|nr:hypothetical protein DYB34_001207 [Aphanomyces astaci]